MPERLPAFQTSEREPEVSAPPRSLWWFKWNSAIAGRDDIINARTWNGSQSGTKDYVISVNSLKTVDSNPFYAFRPQGGTGLNYDPGTGTAKDIEWQEMAAPSAGGAFFKVTAAGGICRKLKKDDPATTVGNDIPVRFIQGHLIGDTLFALHSENGTDQVGKEWLEVLVFAQPAGRYKFIQVVDNTGRIGIDSAHYEG